MGMLQPPNKKSFLHLRGPSRRDKEIKVLFEERSKHKHPKRHSVLSKINPHKHTSKLMKEFRTKNRHNTISTLDKGESKEIPTILSMNGFMESLKKGRTGNIHSS